MVVLPFRSFAKLTAEDLAAISGTLVKRFAEDGAVELVDPVPELADKGADVWLEADTLLLKGMKDYENLEFISAVTSLRRAAELQEETFREFSDTLGRRRMRETYLHLGLSRMEQGEVEEAEDWFARAARVDPLFEPDPRSYPPSARKKFAEAKEGAGVAYESSRDRLRELAKIVGADVIVSGGVRQEDASRWSIEVAWVDRWSGRSAIESVTAAAGDREALVTALDGAGPKLLAGVLSRPWPPGGTLLAVRRRATIGVVGAMLPDASIRHDTGLGQVYEWQEDVLQQGVYVGYAPWERGPWALETDLAVLLPQRMADRGWEQPTNAEGEFQTTAALDARLVHTVNRGGWGVSAGAGVAFNESIAAFRTVQTRSGVVFLWVTPVVTVGASRRLRDVAGVQTYVRLQVGAQYDVLGAGPSDWMFHSVAAGGLAF